MKNLIVTTTDSFNKSLEKLKAALGDNLTMDDQDYVAYTAAFSEFESQFSQLSYLDPYLHLLGKYVDYVTNLAGVNFLAHVTSAKIFTVDELEVLERLEGDLPTRDGTNTMDLLKRYVNYIGDVEGTDFTDFGRDYMSEVKFTESEIKLLQSFSGGKDE